MNKGFYCQSFSIPSPEDEFKQLYCLCCEHHHVPYPDQGKDLDFHIDNLWKKYKEELEVTICHLLSRYMEPGEVNQLTCFLNPLEQMNEREFAKLVVNSYINWLTSPEHSYERWISLETYWRNTVMDAMEEYAEQLFGAEGPCDHFGNPR